jgi:hypothetical protein
VTALVAGRVAMALGGRRGVRAATAARQDVLAAEAKARELFVIGASGEPDVAIGRASNEAST